MDDMARINGKMIPWALRRRGASLESLATARIKPETITEWVNGTAFPSEGQAEELATKLGIAYAMLFMENVPPDAPVKVPDLRTIDGRPIRNPSLGLLEVLDTTRARQEWYRDELLEAGGKPLSFVSRFKLNDSANAVAADMRVVLGLNDAFRSAAKNSEEFLKAMVSKAESLGILVMRSAIVGHATRRSLNLKEFRGFALIDEYAPVIYINDVDAKAAQVFTFAHELAHLWIGASGISDRPPNEKNASRNPTETKCDAIAAEFLVPEYELRPAWVQSHTIDSNMVALSRRFGVGSLVILRRAKDLNLISADVFFLKVDEQYEAYKRREREKREKEEKRGRKRGGNFWNSFEIRNGHRFNAAVLGALGSQRTTYAEAGALFGINPGAAARYAQRVATR